MTNEAVSYALSLIESFKKNSIIMDFVTKEAYEMVASEIRNKTGGGTTAKGVEVLSYSDASIADRVDKYIVSGLVGCVDAAQC